MKVTNKLKQKHVRNSLKGISEIKQDLPTDLTSLL